MLIVQSIQSVQSDRADHTTDVAWDHTGHVEGAKLLSDDVAEDDMEGELEVGLHGPIWC